MVSKGFAKLNSRFSVVCMENEIKFSDFQSEQAAWEYVQAQLEDCDAYKDKEERFETVLETGIEELDQDILDILKSGNWC